MKMPWRTDNGHDIYDAMGTFIGASCHADRIVACVNACAEIKTEILEAHPGKGVFEILVSVVRERDEFLAALKKIAAPGAHLDSITVPLAIARDAIAKASK